MPRNSISRRVARAASIGGSRSYKQRTPLGWYTIVLVVCVVGLGLIVFSRHEREVASENASTTTTTTQANTTPPTSTDHWQEALSVDICGKVVNLPRSADLTSGIITDGNGVVDIEPGRAGKDAKQFEGANATIGKFLKAEGVSLTSTSLRLPNSVGKNAGSYADGRKCGTKPGKLQVNIWATPTSATSYSAAPSPLTNFSANGEMFMLAFVANGASVPKPPGADLVTAFIKSQTTTTTVTTTTIKSGTTTTTKPSSSTTTTTKPSSSTTTTTASGTTTTTG